MSKAIYFFGAGQADGQGSQKDLLGGKGAGLAEMTRLGIPVPPGFTITTEVCSAFFAAGGALPPGLEDELKAFVKGKLAPHKYPRFIEFVPDLPKTATGKIQRFRLREREAALG